MGMAHWQKAWETRGGTEICGEEGLQLPCAGPETLPWQGAEGAVYSGGRPGQPEGMGGGGGPVSAAYTKTPQRTTVTPTAAKRRYAVARAPAPSVRRPRRAVGLPSSPMPGWNEEGRNDGMV